MNNKNLLLTVEEAGISKIQFPEDLISDKDTFPSSQISVFLPCPHMTEGRKELSGGLFNKSTNSIHESSVFII